MESGPKPVPKEEDLYQEAGLMVRRGMSLEQIVKKIDLPKSEIELMIKVNKKAAEI